MSVSTYTSEWKNRTKAQLLDDIQIVIEQRDKALTEVERLREGIDAALEHCDRLSALLGGATS